jgi:hypothetical protein
LGVGSVRFGCRSPSQKRVYSFVLTCALFSVCLVLINNKSAHIPRTNCTCQRFCSPHTTHAHTSTRGNPLVSDPPSRAPVCGAAVRGAPSLAPTADVPTSHTGPNMPSPKSSARTHWVLLLASLHPTFCNIVQLHNHPLLRVNTAHARTHAHGAHIPPRADCRR